MRPPASSVGSHLGRVRHKEEVRHHALRATTSFLETSGPGRKWCGSFALLAFWSGAGPSSWLALGVWRRGGPWSGLVGASEIRGRYPGLCRSVLPDTGTHGRFRCWTLTLLFKATHNPPPGLGLFSCILRHQSLRIHWAAAFSPPFLCS